MLRLAPRIIALTTGARYIDQGDVVRQRATFDCGVAALAMILAHYGHTDGPLDSLRAVTRGRRRGLSFAELQRAAAARGIEARGWAVRPGQLRDVVTPAILHLPNHYVVLDSVRGEMAYLRDPAIGRVRISLRKLAFRWTGRVLVFTPR